jgi:hypothetical protein
MVNTAKGRPLHLPEEFFFGRVSRLARLALAFQRLLHRLEFEALTRSG